MGLGDVGAGGGGGVAGHGRSVLCRFLSCDLGHLLGGCEGPKGSGSEGLRHGWGWGGARGELQLPLEEPLPTWAPASLGLAPRVLPWAWRPECRQPGAQSCAHSHRGPAPCPAAACPIGSSWKGVAQSPTVR